MMTRIILVATILLANSGFSAVSNVAHAKEFLNDLIKLSENVRASGSDEERKALMRKISSSVDFEGLARKSLGKHWAKTTKAKREEFLQVLRELVEKVLYPRAKRINSKIGDIKFSDIPGKSGNVRASTKYEYEKAGDLVSRNVEIEILYGKVGGRLQIVDAILEGEQVSLNLNRQFSQILEKRTIDDVLKRMREKLKVDSASGLISPNEKLNDGGATAVAQ